MDHKIQMRWGVDLMRRIIRDRKGATAVEFAVIAPLLIMVIFGTLEVGRALYVHSTIQHAIEVSGRYAMVHPNASSAELRKIANANGLSLLGNTDAGANSVSFTVNTVNLDAMKVVVITADIAHKMSAPLLSTMKLTITAQTRVPTKLDGTEPVPIEEAVL